LFANLRLRLTNLRKKTTDIDWTTRKYFAVFLVIIYIIIFSLVLPYSTTTALEIISSQEQHDFIIPINITLNGTTGFGDPDVVVSLNFKYSKEILVVNDPVNIIGLVVLKSDLADNLTRIVITIENCMEYEKFDQWGIPEQAFLVFDNAPMYRSFRFDEDAKRIVYFINADVKANWHVDGNHKPIIGFYYEDGTNTTRIMDDFSVPVYPKEQLT
jgi:hypothetical protein